MTLPQPNTGRRPEAAAGKRVNVTLRNGMRPAESWAADGRAGCNWSLNGHPFDITHFKIV
ncbi:hypothetical protein GRI97_15685 [Altererythrobacter xixiisoli]|uniref:Uncharacterized protein n=1 Tax=Croceibacterium xixiisoli TaxID=1476466 RepID=A0A6I4TX09_9SPHN|nr:hypothetical protein [Croceibacterium xixiisoli]MXP00433.1 hypothetical protein [Croceibacterium xixiisoli]